MNKPDHPASQLLEQHLRMVCVLVNLAANCDLVLFNAFKVISGCDSKTANAIYFAFEALQTKKTIISRILKANADEEESKIVQAIVGATEKANKKRNDISHALLQISGDQVFSLNARQQGKPPKTLTVQYLDDLHRQASTAHVLALRE